MSARGLSAAGAAWAYVKGLYEQWNRHPMLLLASGISFHAILCLIPLIILGTSILGTVLNSSDRAVQNIDEILNATFPQNPYAGEIQATLKGVLTDVVAYRSSFGWVGMAILLWTSSSLLNAVRTALNTVFHLHGADSFLRGMVKTVVLTLVLTLLFLAANLSTWLFIVAGTLLERWSILDSARAGSLIPTAILLFSNVPIVLMYFILYRFVPGKGIPTRAALVGAGSATVIWWVSGIAFGRYLTSFGSYGSVYGTYAFLIVFLLWIYYSSSAFMVGAMICQQQRKHMESSSK